MFALLFFTRMNGRTSGTVQGYLISCHCLLPPTSHLPPPYRAISEATASHWHTRHGPQHASSAARAEGGTDSQRPDGALPASSSANSSSGPHRSGAAAASAAGAGCSDEGDSGDWAQKGRWDYVVGLVGKPSAGKSTFYNAVVDPLSEAEGARVAAFPVRGWVEGG